MKYLIANNSIDKEINNLIYTILMDIKKNYRTNLISIKALDKYTLDHSLNVAILSLRLGVALNMSYEDLYELGVGALLHDIGKIFIPLSILNKKDKLTEEEFETIKKHTMIGYEYTKFASNIPINSKLAILEHHERINGTGYPNNRTADEIHRFAKIVSICDVYDAYTSKRVYKQAKKSEGAIDFIDDNANTLFDKDLSHVFINQVYKTIKAS